MSTWFLCKVEYMRQDEDGNHKKVKESYLLDAVNFTDAEARIHEEVGRQLNDFVVTNVTKQKISDVYKYSDSDVWYRCKVQYTTFDEASGKEKNIKDLMLVTALDLREAHDRIMEKLGAMQVPFEIIEVQKSVILEVFPYKSPDERIPMNLKPVE